MSEMGFGLKSYIIETQNGLLTLDVNFLLKLSDKKFKEIHLEENQSFYG